MSLVKCWRYCRITPFDESTEQGRADERYRLVLLALAANVLSRVMGLVTMIVSVKLTISYLGPERFGVWSTIASMVGILGFLDLGVGNALANKVSKVAASKEPQALRDVVSGGLAYLSVLGGLVSLFLILFLQLLPWKDYIKVGSDSGDREVYHALLVLAILMGFSILTGGAQRIFAGLQRAYEAHVVNLSFSLLSLGLMLIAARFQAGIPFLVGITVGVQILAGGVLVGILFYRKILVPRGAWKNALVQRRHLILVGGGFFVLQVCWGLASGFDNVLIMATHGAGQAAVYSVGQRLFQFVSQPLVVMNAPLWAAYADALARGETRFVLMTFRRSLASTLLLSCFGGGLVLVFGESFTQWWTGGTVSLPGQLASMFFFLTVIEATGNVVATLLSGCGIVREQAVCVLTLTILVLLIKPFVLNLWGVPEMLLAYVLVYSFVMIGMYGVLFRKSIAERLGAE